MGKSSTGAWAGGLGSFATLPTCVNGLVSRVEKVQHFDSRLAPEHHFFSKFPCWYIRGVQDHLPPQNNIFLGLDELNIFVDFFIGPRGDVLEGPQRRI